MGDQRKIEVDLVDEGVHRLRLIEAHADGADVASAPELLESLDAALEERALMPGDCVAEKPSVEIVDDQCVNGRNAQPLQGLLVGAHDAVVGIVEHGLEGEPANPGRAVERFGVRRSLQGPANLGRNPDALARRRSQK